MFMSVSPTDCEHLKAMDHVCVLCPCIPVPGPQYVGQSFSFLSLGTQVWLCQCLLRDAGKVLLALWASVALSVEGGVG